MIFEASIRDKTRGKRVLVTRYWPRGFRRGSFDMWLRDLAPSAGLLKRYKGGLPWTDFEEMYRVEMAAEAGVRALGELRRLGDTEDVTILCYERFC